MIELKNVSKFYYNKGIIASGISRVNLKLDRGEFVVITGESGSGKSTLLNVISGMDSYEEGEMFIEGRPTSHFMEKDFAEYRKHYIGNVFQEFNLINSYTVYQNVELVLLINGVRRQFVRQKVRDILEKVGMSAHAGTKVSKLSGGQMQRVAIARALAKETDIIVADEPTGNLDSSSAEEIVELLSEISKDKLVIVVTHDFEQFRARATRMIRMHDGRIAEDLRLARRREIKREMAQEPEPAEKTRSRKKEKRGRQLQTGRLSGTSKVRLGVRNTFNVVPKFLLLLIVFAFLLTAVTSQYTSYLSQKDESSKVGYNNYFTNLTLDRIVIKKNDGSPFDAADEDAISSISNVKSIAEADILRDSVLYLEDEDFSYQAVPRADKEMTGTLLTGRMPQAKGEVVLAVSKGETPKGEAAEKNLDKTYLVDTDQYETKEALKVVGLAQKEEGVGAISDYAEVYMTPETLDLFLANMYHEHSSIDVTLNGKKQTAEPGDTAYDIMKCDKVKKGDVLAPPEANSYFDDNVSKGKSLKAGVSNAYYAATKTLKIKDIYTEKNYEKLTGRKDFEMTAGVLFVSPEDYYDLFTPDNYQATIYVEDVESIDDTKRALEEAGYSVLPLKDVLVPLLSDMMQMIQLPITIVVILALFFITYFVIRLIMRSRTGYYSILRMLGMDRKAVRRIIDIELVTVMTIAFMIFAAAALLATFGYLPVEQIRELVRHMQLEGYVILYVIMLIMSLMISGKFSRHLFKDSAMSVYREEV